MGGSSRKLDALAERYPLVCHGLSLSLGGPVAARRRLSAAAESLSIIIISRLAREHLSCCSDDGHLYDLPPLPFTAGRSRHVAQTHPPRAADTGTAAGGGKRFVLRPCADQRDERTAVHPGRADAADCQLHLDVNNIHVNSVNFATPAPFLPRCQPGGSTTSTLPAITGKAPI